LARQLALIGVVQAPAPLHTDAVVPTAVAQVAAAHTVVLPG
jgi:hypothetical protein